MHTASDSIAHSHRALLVNSALACKLIHSFGLLLPELLNQPTSNMKPSHSIYLCCSLLCCADLHKLAPFWASAVAATEQVCLNPHDRCCPRNGAPEMWVARRTQ